MAQLGRARAAALRIPCRAIAVDGPGARRRGATPGAPLALQRRDPGRAVAVARRATPAWSRRTRARPARRPSSARRACAPASRTGRSRGSRRALRERHRRRRDARGRGVGGDAARGRPLHGGEARRGRPREGRGRRRRQRDRVPVARRRGRAPDAVRGRERGGPTRARTRRARGRGRARRDPGPGRSTTTGGCGWARARSRCRLAPRGRPDGGGPRRRWTGAPRSRSAPRSSPRRSSQGPANADGSTAKEQMRTRRLARAACAVAALRVDTLPPSAPPKRRDCRPGCRARALRLGRAARASPSDLDCS